MSETHPAERVAALFRRQFGRAPEALWRAPGRVNLIGDHTDYEGGLALPMALPLGVWLAAAPRHDGVVRALTDVSGAAVERPVDELRREAREAPPQHDWAGFVRGVWALVPEAPGADIAVTSTLPMGVGLSSSAALGMALLAAADGLGHGTRSLLDLVRLGQTLENRYLGVATGIMDQMAVAFGRSGSAVLIDAARAAARPVAFDYAAAGMALWVVDSGMPRQLSASAYGERVAECRQARDLLGVLALSNARPADLASLPPTLARRARHVLSENQRVRTVVEAARTGNWAAVRSAFWASHQSLADDYEVSVEALDVIVEVARSLDIGARLTGAGFGGSVVALGDHTHYGAFQGALAAAYRERGWSAPQFITVPEPAAGLERL